MESGGSSNQQKRDTTRASASAGTVIPEAGSGGAAANIPAANAGDQNPPQPRAFRREADQYMPMANIVRIMRGVLPPQAKIADDAKEAIQECVSEFIGVITSAANERCHSDYRKTISPEDVISAMSSLGFTDYVEPLTVFINKHRAEDPERGSMNLLLPVVRREGATHQPPASQVAPPPAADGPTVIAGDEEVDNPEEYIGFPEIIREYFMKNTQGGTGDDGGEGSSRAGGN